MQRLKQEEERSSINLSIIYQVTVQGVSVRCFFEASTNVPGYMGSGYRLLLRVQPQKRQSPGYPLNCNYINDFFHNHKTCS